MSRPALAMAALLVAGCGPALEEVPGQAEATQLVWSTFGASGQPPPVEWHQEQCPSRPDDLRTAVVHQGACYSGLYLRDDRAMVAWRGSLHASAFAHELMHAWQWARNIDDPDHLRSDEWELVARAERALAGGGK